MLSDTEWKAQQTETKRVQSGRDSRLHCLHAHRL